MTRLRVSFLAPLRRGIGAFSSLRISYSGVDSCNRHTSVVVFNKEVYYGPYNAGPGIQVVSPGQSHHGQPLRVEDVGETEIDEETFMEYLSDIREMYTGENVSSHGV